MKARKGRKSPLTGWIVRYDAGGYPDRRYLAKTGFPRLSPEAIAPEPGRAKEFRTSRAAERAAMEHGMCCYTLRRYSRRYWQRFCKPIVFLVIGENPDVFGTMYRICGSAERANREAAELVALIRSDTPGLKRKTMVPTPANWQKVLSDLQGHYGEDTCEVAILELEVMP